MKTTLELPDELLLEAKTIAIQRKTTLKALMEHALRREIEPMFEDSFVEEDCIFEVGPHGIPRLKRSGKSCLTSEMVRDLMEEES